MIKKISFVLISLLCLLPLSSCDSDSNLIETSVVTETSEEKNKEYTITVSSCKNGSITADKTHAKPGDVITVTTKADFGYVLDTAKFTYVSPESTREYKIINESFLMPAFNVTIKAEFVKTHNVRFVVNGRYEYTETVNEGSIPTKYWKIITNQYHVLVVYTDSGCTKFYRSTEITNDTTLYCTRKLNLFSKVSENKNKIEYSNNIVNNDILANVITNAKCTLYKEALLKITLKVGDLAIVTTDTKYQNMSFFLMLSLAGGRGEAGNGGGFSKFFRDEDFYGHSVLIFSVTQPGDYYIAVTYSPEAYNKYGASFLSTSEYIFDITAVINDGYLL